MQNFMFYVTGTESPADRCDFLGVNFFVFVLKEWRTYMAQYGSLYHKRRCNSYYIFNLDQFIKSS